MITANTIRPIRSEKDYEEALARIEQLMDAESGTPEDDEIDVLATLVEVYEQKHFPIDLPNPIEAIRFRMEQQGLTNRDLEPYLGSRAKVSEVLSGKRPLTLRMIRALHENLGIPAEALLQKEGASLPESFQDIDWGKFPVKEMAKLGWFGNDPNVNEHAEELMRELIEEAGGFQALPEPHFRANAQIRKKAIVDEYALKAWCLKLLATARQRRKQVAEYVEASITMDFCRNLVRNSWSQEGPKLAKEFLEKSGIQLIYLPHLLHTHMDGAALQLEDGTPVIGLTLRYDRLDNFWFCLCHELAHVSLHMRNTVRMFFVDDLSQHPAPKVRDEREREADNWAQEALIPAAEWQASGIGANPTVAAILGLSQRLGIHPAIIAGRVRRETGNYHLFTHYVGNGEVVKHFLEPRVREK